MTPAMRLLLKQKISHKTHQYQHQKSAVSYGQEAATMLNVPPVQIFKTLVACLDNNALVVAIIPITAQLNMKLLAKAAGAKKAKMAQAKDVERSTGYVLGGVSPLGQKKRLQTFLDNSANVHQAIFISAGKRGLEIEISAKDLLHASAATLADLQQG